MLPSLMVLVFLQDSLVQFSNHSVLLQEYNKNYLDIALFQTMHIAKGAGVHSKLQLLNFILSIFSIN